MEIKVLGPGCARCEATKKNVEDALSESGADAKITKVTDAMEIAKHGVFGTPAVVIHITDELPGIALRARLYLDPEAKRKQEYAAADEFVEGLRIEVENDSEMKIQEPRK